VIYFTAKTDIKITKHLLPKNAYINARMIDKQGKKNGKQQFKNRLQVLNYTNFEWANKCLCDNVLRIDLKKILFEYYFILIFDIC